MAQLAPLEVSDEDRVELERRVRSTTTAQRDVTRARIVLAARAGWSNRAIGADVAMHYNQVAVWRRRFAERGLAGLKDEPRPGRPLIYGHTTCCGW